MVKSSPCPMHIDKYCMVVVQMQRKPRAGADRTITHSHTYYIKWMQFITQFKFAYQVLFNFGFMVYSFEEGNAFYCQMPVFHFCLALVSFGPEYIYHDTSNSVLQATVSIKWKENLIIFVNFAMNRFTWYPILMSLWTMKWEYLGKNHQRTCTFYKYKCNWQTL